MTRKARRGSNERCGEREKIGHPYFVLFCFVMSALSPYLFLSIYLTFFLKRTHRREGKRGKIHTAALSFAYRDAPRDPRCWGRCETRGRGIAFRRFELVSFDFDFDADRYANVRLYIFLALICLSVGLVWRAERFLPSIGGLILCNEIQIKSP